MSPRDSSGIARYSSTSEQRSIRDPGTEHELLDYVREQYLILREDMTAKEVQARKLEEQLEDQRKMLTEIRNLVLRLNNQRQKDERADENIFD